MINLGNFGLREAEEAVAIENDDPVAAAAALKLTKLTIAPLAKIDELGHVTSELDQSCAAAELLTDADAGSANAPWNSCNA